ncbi:hypothetical protein BBJ28_00002005 [Nothophytophthora sp. Chile5]|nr:hypothetical protein BBJ28_00002005 [Nothophytophthora sp. Chile5]
MNFFGCLAVLIIALTATTGAAVDASAVTETGPNARHMLALGEESVMFARGCSVASSPLSSSSFHRFLAMATLSELRDALAALGVSTSTGSLRGEERRAELARRLKEVHGGAADDTAAAVGLTHDRETLQLLPLADLRSALEHRQLSTQTPGLKGDARRHALIQRLLHSHEGQQSPIGFEQNVADTPRSNDGFAGDDANSVSSSSSYSAAGGFLFYDLLSTRTSSGREQSVEAVACMPEIPLGKLKSQGNTHDTAVPPQTANNSKPDTNTTDTEQLQQELFTLRKSLHSARLAQHDEVERSLQEAGFSTSLDKLSNQLQDLERERRRLQQNYFSHELVTSAVLTSDRSNQPLPEFVQEDALQLIMKRQASVKQLVERTKEAAAIAKSHAIQKEEAGADSAKSAGQKELSLLREIQKRESQLRTQQTGNPHSSRSEPQLSTSHSKATSLLKTKSVPEMALLARCRSIPNGLFLSEWKQMNPEERSRLHSELRTAASFHIRQNRVLLGAAESIAAVSPLIQSPRNPPTLSDKLGIKARFLEHSKRNPVEINFAYQQAIDLDPKHAENLGNYALFLCKTLQQMNGAQHYFERAIEADPMNAKNLANYANFLKSERGDLSKSDVYYQRALEVAPTDVNILGSYADLLSAKARDDHERLLEGRQVLESALAISPTHINNRLRLARVCSTLGDYEMAGQCFELLLAAVKQSGQERNEKPNDVHVRTGFCGGKSQERLAKIYGSYAAFLHKCGYWARAKHMYGEALALDPQRPTLLRNL